MKADGRDKVRILKSMLSQSEPMVEIFFALSDETRLSLISKLSARSLSATSLSQSAAVTRQAIVKHLQVLESAGLVSHKKHGREVLYELEPRRLEDARAFLEQIEAGWNRAIHRLRNMVEERPARAARIPRGR
jgi:DNA-binding transcriptional ArsR family regulator